MSSARVGATSLQGQSFRPKAPTAAGKAVATTISAKVNLSPKKYLPFPRLIYFCSNFLKKNLNFSSAFF